MIPVKDYLRENHLVQSRVIWLAALVILLTMGLVLRMGYLQVVDYDRLEELSQRNRVDLTPLSPVRGLIYDRNGTVLAENFRVFNLEVLPDRVKNMERLLNEIQQIVDISDDELARFNKLTKARPGFESQILKANLSEEEAAKVAVHQYQFEGASLQARLQRYYPLGALTGSVIGYVGRISAKDLKSVDKADYRGAHYIGKRGVEAYYEDTLRGEVGYKEVEMNAHGRIIRGLQTEPPVTGQTLHLTLDVPLQKRVFEEMEGYEGAVVAIEPSSGEVLAFASVPSYDPNPFVNGISSKAYNLLRTSEERPLVNRALQGRYAPGSTIKGFMGLVAIDNGFDFNQSIFCPGYYTLPNVKHRYRCWRHAGHGHLTGEQAIEQSCDVYFYRMASSLGIDKMSEGMKKFGFGKTTGVDLLGEPSGLMPSREWKRRVKKTAWYPGETVITGIGQGAMLVTPMQLAQVTATLANGGSIVRPRFLRAMENPQSQTLDTLEAEFTGNVQVATPQAFEHIIDGMVDVVHGRRGTARHLGKDIAYKMAGKTGTAQVKSIAQGERYNEEETAKKHRDHSLFVGFAPLDNPQIAIAVVVEHGGSGSKTAAPIAKRVMDYYLTERLGMFPATEETDVNQVTASQ